MVSSQVILLRRIYIEEILDLDFQELTQVGGFTYLVIRSESIGSFVEKSLDNSAVDAPYKAALQLS